MNIYMIHTHEFGFEPGTYTDTTAAQLDATKLALMAAYRGKQVRIVAIDPIELAKIANTVLTATASMVAL